MNAFCLNDFYKFTHLLQYPSNVFELTSYLTPRSSRLPGIDKVLFFGLHGYISKYVVKGFNENFFNLPLTQVVDSVIEVLIDGLNYPENLVDETVKKLTDLYKLGYLPVSIKAVHEGELVPMGCPCVEIKSTHPDFPWVGQALEASLSAAIWHPMVSATIGREYLKIAKEYFSETVEDDIDPRSAMCDFSMRGQESNESAIASSAGWLCSMKNSSTVAARFYIKDHYVDTIPVIVNGLTSTEHSVMTSHACLNGGDETPTFKYLFDLYKDVSFAAVCDSYDFWGVLTNILPKFKDIINERGKRGLFCGVRHDSSDPVLALCGNPNSKLEWERKGMVETMYELFGGSINSKGYKVLNPGIKAVYGDSITLTRAREIYKRLKEKGFAANNVSLGVGSFSMQCMEGEDGKLYPFTRDSFSIAIKCTHSKYIDENKTIHEQHVFKEPKNFNGKKSQKGLCAVYYNQNGLTYKDELYETDLNYHHLNSLEPYFINGVHFKTSFNSIRKLVDKYV